MAKHSSAKVYGLIVKFNVIAILIVVTMGCITVFLEDGDTKWVLYLVMMIIGIYILFASTLMVITQIQYKKIAENKKKKEKAKDNDKPID